VNQNHQNSLSNLRIKLMVAK